MNKVIFFRLLSNGRFTGSYGSLGTAVVSTQEAFLIFIYVNHGLNGKSAGVDGSTLQLSFTKHF